MKNILSGGIQSMRVCAPGCWLTSLLIVISCAAFAQQRPIQSLYMFDPLLVNPAYAGTHVQLSGTGIYRNQWVNFDGAPKTFTGTIHSGFRKARVGLGLIFTNDQIGVHSDNSLYGVYSYKIPVSPRKDGGVLSMGIQAGFNVLKSDYFKTNPRDGAEVGVISKFNPNFGAGAFYRGKNLYAGISVPYILNNKIIDIIDVEMDTFNTSGKQQRYYYLMGGFTKTLSKDVKWMPSTLIRLQNNAPLSFDINSMFIFYDVVGLGFSYRIDDAVIGLFELQINENFHVGYAYDITMSDIRLYSNGSHEIMINYRIKLPKIHQGIPCPSYW
ncbi:MAG: type IX secretion system membrane protein PorP/SprF [Bacteroidota bacterium]|nr:type IX secretion system membrane protein PorP/SprF [Bacteroidota bacterium]